MTTASSLTHNFAEVALLTSFGWHCSFVKSSPLLEYSVEQDSNKTSEFVSAVNSFGRYTLPTYFQTLAATHQNYLTFQRNSDYNNHNRNDNSRAWYFMELVAILVLLSLFILYKTIKRWYQFRSNTTTNRRMRNQPPTERSQQPPHSIDMFPRPVRDPHIRDTASALSEQGLPSYEEVTKFQEALPSYDEALTHPVSNSAAQDAKSVQSMNSSEVDIDDRVQVFTIPVRNSASLDVRNENVETNSVRPSSE